MEYKGRESLRRSKRYENSPNTRKRKLSFGNDEVSEKPSTNMTVSKNEPQKKISSGSFYGGKQSKYLNPLERKKAKLDIEVVTFHPKKIENLKTKAGNQNQRNKKTAPHKVKKKKENIRVNEKNKKEPLAEISPQKMRTPQKQRVTSEKTDGKKPEASKQEIENISSGKKFFKNRSPRKSWRSPRKNRSRVIVQKGFDLKFQSKKAKANTKSKKLKKDLSKSLVINTKKRTKPVKTEKIEKNSSDEVDFHLDSADSIHVAETNEETTQDNKQTENIGSKAAAVTADISQCKKEAENSCSKIKEKKSQGNIVFYGADQSQNVRKVELRNDRQETHEDEDFFPLEICGNLKPKRKSVSKEENKNCEDDDDDFFPKEMCTKLKDKNKGGATVSEGNMKQPKINSSKQVLCNKNGSKQSELIKPGQKEIPDDVASCTSSVDSVVLLSETTSNLSESSSDTNDSQNQKKKLFSIFTTGGNAKSSPNSGKAAKSQNTPRSNKKTNTEKVSPRQRRGIKDKDGRHQMVLDFGQKRIGATQCNECGMTYSIGDPVDEETHIRYHRDRKPCTVPKLAASKKETVLQEFPDGSKVIQVRPHEKKAMKKVEEIMLLVDEDLGFVIEGKKIRLESKIFLYVTESRHIVGCCIAEIVKQGYRMIADTSTTDDSEAKPQPWCCSVEPEPVKCGINRIWVVRNERRKGIARRLLECVRCHFLFGTILSKDEIAFSDPTPHGKLFATSYAETPTFLVYKHV